MKYLDLMIKIGDQKLDYIYKNGHAKAGGNGPYKNRDTPVRNSGHWLITYAYLYEKTGEKKYFNAVEILADFLINKKNYGISGGIRHRTDYRFDSTNGIIGQAWTIESLVAAGKFFNDFQYYNKAVEIFQSQKFNCEHNFWEINDYNGDRDFDRTFNHQLWYAASGAQILQFECDCGLEPSESIDKQILLFMDEAEKRYFTIYEDGLIVHVMSCNFSEKEERHRVVLENRRKITSLIHSPLLVVKKKISDKRAKYPFSDGLEMGYQIFDLYGFALLYGRYKNHSLYKSEKFKKAVHYALDTDAMLELMHPCGGYPFNKFAFAYNSPAFEYPYVKEIFKGNGYDIVASKLLKFQIDKIFDKNKCSMCVQCDDPETMDSRIYEIVRFLEIVG